MMRDTPQPGIDQTTLQMILSAHSPDEAGEPGFAGQELLHRGLFEVALLGDEPVQARDPLIRIGKRRRYRPCSARGRKRNNRLRS